jgi:hypothetical protein
MITQTQERNYAKEQAKAQLESIVEMVTALNEERARECASREYVSSLDRDQCVALLLSIDIQSFDTETIEDLREAVAVNITDETLDPEDFSFGFDEEEARERIQEDPLSIQLRSGWYAPGEEKPDAEEFEILLCTGGPAVRIVGDLDGGQPDRPRLQYQDWGTPWTEYFIENDSDREALQTYCEQFYFGE